MIVEISVDLGTENQQKCVPYSNQYRRKFCTHSSPLTPDQFHFSQATTLRIFHENSRVHFDKNKRFGMIKKIAKLCGEKCQVLE